MTAASAIKQLSVQPSDPIGKRDLFCILVIVFFDVYFNTVVYITIGEMVQSYLYIFRLSIKFLILFLYNIWSPAIYRIIVPFTRNHTLILIYHIVLDRPIHDKILEK